MQTYSMEKMWKAFTAMQPFVTSYRTKQRDKEPISPQAFLSPPASKNLYMKKIAENQIYRY